MTTWTVQCGCTSYDAATMTVEADTLDEALERAIETAKTEASWKPLDYCGPIFVDAVAEGADADPWRGHISTISVPERFKEHGVSITERDATALITIFIARGIVQLITFENAPARVIVRNYDTNGFDAATLHTDADGNRYARGEWSNELPPGGG